MRYLLLLILALSAFAVDDSPRVEPTTVDRVQGAVDPTTGKIEVLHIFDINEAVDPTGRKMQIGERSTTIKRADEPQLFNRLDALLEKTAERDQAHKTRKAERIRKRDEE